MSFMFLLQQVHSAELSTYAIAIDARTDHPSEAIHESDAHFPQKINNLRFTVSVFPLSGATKIWNVSKRRLNDPTQDWTEDLGRVKATW